MSKANDVEIVYEPLPHQQKFHDAQKNKVYLSAGFGAGKTYSLVMHMFMLMNKNPGCAGGVMCPTLKMFKRDVLPTIRDICFDNDIPFSHNKSDHVFYFPTTQSTVYVFHAEDDGRSIRGPNLAFMCINEVSLCSQPSFYAALSRVRLKEAPFRQIAMSGTPEGFTWVYDYFVEDQRDDTDFIFGNTRENIYIAEDYVQTLIDSYDELMVEQYVEGKFVNLSGNRAAYAFDRRRHTQPYVDKVEDGEVWVSMDFNVNPMSATLWNRMGSNSKHILQAFDEIKLNGSNTWEMADVLKKKVNPMREYVTIYPDPAGQSRSTKSKNKSDIDILKDCGFQNIKYRSRAPRVRDALNACNSLFSKDKIIISSKRCRNLIADLEQCIIKQGTHDIDKSDPKRTHWLDGLKYMVDYEFPISGNYIRFREQRIR